MNYPEAANRAPKQSGGALKWILLGCGGFVLLLVALFATGGYLMFKSFNTDPAKVEAAAQEILTFEKPAGMKGAASMSMMGFKMATFVTENPKQEGPQTLMVASLPSGKQNQEQVQQQIDANMKQQGHSREGMERRPPETFKVLGNDVTAQVGAITDKNTNARSLQYMLTFEKAPGKMTMIQVIGSEQTVDHAWVQKFLDTVK